MARQDVGVSTNAAATVGLSSLSRLTAALPTNEQAVVRVSLGTAPIDVAEPDEGREYEEEGYDDEDGAGIWRRGCVADGWCNLASGQAEGGSRGRGDCLKNRGRSYGGFLSCHVRVMVRAFRARG